jgi:hypothetical protein
VAHQSSESVAPAHWPRRFSLGLDTKPPNGELGKSTFLYGFQFALNNNGLWRITWCNWKHWRQLLHSASVTLTTDTVHHYLKERNRTLVALTMLCSLRSPVS